MSSGDLPSIIAVDDEEILLELLQTVLEANFHIETANNALLALEKIKNKRYDLILTDIKMPKMNGIEFIKKVRTELKVITPIIVISGYSQLEPEANQFLQQEAAHVLAKPLPPVKDLISLLQNTLKPKI